jgi:hypothetical protein
MRAKDVYHSLANFQHFMQYFPLTSVLKLLTTEEDEPTCFKLAVGLL